MMFDASMFGDQPERAPATETPKLGAKRGDIFKVGRGRWLVFRARDDYSATVYKHGTARRNVYEMVVADRDGTVEVWQIGGSGQRVKPSPTVRGKASKVGHESLEEARRPARRPGVYIRMPTSDEVKEVRRFMRADPDFTLKGGAPGGRDDKPSVKLLRAGGGSIFIQRYTPFTPEQGTKIVQWLKDQGYVYATYPAHYDEYLARPVHTSHFTAHRVS